MVLTPGRAPRAGGLVLLLASAAAPGQDAARPEARLGAIRGRVEVRRELSPVEPRPSVADLGRGPVRDRPDRRRSVVYLETAPQGAFEDHDRTRAVLDQRNEAFVPYVLAIPVGATVDFPNSDRTYHNVFSFSKARRFDLGRYGRGVSKFVRFDKPGVVRVFCEIHSHMSAFILVFAHRFFATTDAEGRYRIDDVPAGAYTLAAWNDGEVRESRAVRVPEGGTVELDFVVR
ncbi:MAG TPA: carboxypeptidase regulatory-like domain-containing protein [Vicinamibacteria bacterium]